MPLILKAPPAVEPIALAEAKLHLRLDDSVEDAAIEAMIAAARLHMERAYGLALITQSWTLRLDDWPCRAHVPLPLWPLIAITSLKVLGEDDQAFLIDEAHYFAELHARPARIFPRAGRRWPKPGRPSSGIEIDFTAGFGPAPSDVPEPIRQALKLSLGLLYEDRDGLGPAREPGTVAALMSSYRECRL